ncbi:ANTI-SILENCING PROTEIN 1 [Encephalitozoon cuniculi GB-M1]|uniref:Histone chaperone ASF1 n=2 Tax=Encephalitozoon cuniculi TaxID=6035 RepID=ASF1_ENCCU|nr:nucleosome assembly factor ASF1 [Encephalitozoon cuniculi GB-M1]Q8SRM1.1 RecName: Full=Histone chaperone ASF1; AltName: Full=Anti-silencing function protein 1 [Encephalitozoon cuniculi GB-M1]AGE96372.1 anti-silencing protein 1 [Encephalitozoon cuniculi]KMV65736.1 gene silencing histone chaperone [Encephalitozoon cuniculi EcunIII-L]CAD25545.1 ANTI-SILENCING PROTEIN 1 [Encephalitozoon cuniculi GB-M1]
MGHLKLKSIEVDSTVKKLGDPLKFNLRFVCFEEIKCGVEFVVLYNMDVHSDENDQVLAEIEVAPIPKGKIEFSIDADAPDVNKIPLDEMFGLTSILIVGRYKGQQFIRIGYIVDVGYPGIPSTKLMKSDVEEPSEEIGDKEEEDEEDVEEELGSEEGSEESSCIVEDKDEDNEEAEPRTFMEAVEDVGNEGKERLFESEGREEEEDEKVGSDSYSEVNRELNKSVGEEAEGSDGGEDVVDYCGFRIDKKQIEMKLMDPPVINLFEIEWEEESPSEEVPRNNNESPAKKQKVE